MKCVLGLGLMLLADAPWARSLSRLQGCFERGGRARVGDTVWGDTKTPRRDTHSPVAHGDADWHAACAAWHAACAGSCRGFSCTSCCICATR
jgi:hypothetical protein